MIWFKDYKIEDLAGFLQQRGLTALLGITLAEIGPDFLHARMPVTADLMQVHAIMHGGATCALVETVGSVASRLCIDPKLQFSVGSYIQVNHLRQVQEGAVVIAKAKAVHIGRQKHVWDIPVYIENSDKLIAKGELTCAVLNNT